MKISLSSFYDPGDGGTYLTRLSEELRAAYPWVIF